MEYQHITHESLKPFVPKGARILILGSFPSIATRAAGFYYAHKTNRFWKVLAAIFDEKELTSIQEKKDFLTRHKIALYDTIEACDIQASSDASIKNVISAKETIEEIKRKERISYVFTTGSTSSKLYQKYIGKDNIPLLSPSAANAATSFEKLKENYLKIVCKLNELN